MKTNPLAFFINQLEMHTPAPLRPVQAQVKSTIKQAAQAQFSRFDLVPRAQFEAQQRQIAQLNRQIAALEARLAALEAAE
ncbi:accessory factor UbiK family protein [Suttonella indologenes]|uniref:Uncharacterized protein conserved in bacteria n=1 Tax=Suttonella indologenes TaxID=13276 RepID=A0A380MKU4_9GAMM|nr:accessory factor UbiK family protein [Suttonella indologenes]SUO92657.1 Uncharacterized protein conserved in bacteria [Suttonella indologenes]